MELTVAALVGYDRNERIEVRLPGLSASVFRGSSLAELLDDAALHLMERVPRWKPDQLERLVLNPRLTVRNVGLKTELAFGQARRKVAVKVRLTAVCETSPHEPFWRVRLPRLGSEVLLVGRLGELSEAVQEWLVEWAKTGTLAQLESAAALKEPHLILLDVDVDLPTVLPSRRPKRKRRKREEAKEPQEDPPREKTWIPAVELPRVGVNLCHRALDGRLRPALGRDQLVDDLVHQLEREGSAILLVGEPGVGKTAIIEAVAQRLAEQGGTMKERTDCWRVDGSRLIAGMSMVGQWEARLARVVDEIHQREDVLVVDDLPSLSWAGRSAQSDTTMSGFLTPHLERGELRVLGECSLERLAAARLVDPGFFSHFRIVHVPRLDPLSTYQVLLSQSRAIEHRRNLACAPDVLDSVQQLASRFGVRSAEPGRSVSLLQRFLGEVDPEKDDRYGRRVVDLDALRAHLRAETGLPDFVLTPGMARSADQVEAWFRRHIVGQPRAVDVATDVVCTLQQGLDDPDRPIATLLFVGPTGVGKTETAKALAAYLFGDAGKLLRFDMSEVQGPGAIERLVGGARRPDGELTRAVANQPFSVVLLDEIEKAGSQVFDLLLQVLGEGRLTNAAGRTTDFRNTVVVMTSNLGAREGRRRTGFARATVEADAAHYRSAAEGFFRPELFNRIDRVVPFRALGAADVEPLVQRIVARVLGRRGLRSAGVVVRLDAEVREHLAEVGFDPQYGARSLQRVVERELAVPLARVLVRNPPIEHGLFLDVWRDGDTRVATHPLVGREAFVGRGPLETWEAIRAQHQALVDRLTELGESAPFAALQDERSSLLERAGDGLDDAEWDRLGAATAVVEGLDSVLGALEDFATDRLGSHRYVDTHERVVLTEHKWFGPKHAVLGRSEPVPIDRRRTLSGAAAGLLQIELRAAEVMHRLAHVADHERTIVRFSPLHEEAGAFARQLAEAFASCWGSWGRCETWRWRGDWERGALIDGAVALELAVPGLSELLDGVAGAAIHGADLGADRRLSLVRVDVRRGEAEAVLASMAREDQERLAASRRQEAGVVPPVRLRFGSLRPDVPEAPRLETLADDLGRLCLLAVVR